MRERYYKIRNAFTWMHIINQDIHKQLIHTHMCETVENIYMQNLLSSPKGLCVPKVENGFRLTSWGKPHIAWQGWLVRLLSCAPCPSETTATHLGARSSLCLWGFQDLPPLGVLTGLGWREERESLSFKRAPCDKEARKGLQRKLHTCISL